MSSMMKVDEFSEKLISNSENFTKFILSFAGTNTEIGILLEENDGHLPFELWLEEFGNWMANGAPVPNQVVSTKSETYYNDFETYMFSNENPFGDLLVSKR